MQYLSSEKGCFLYFADFEVHVSAWESVDMQSPPALLKSPEPGISRKYAESQCALHACLPNMIDEPVALNISGIYTLPMNDVQYLVGAAI